MLDVTVWSCVRRVRAIPALAYGVLSLALSLPWAPAWAVTLDWVTVGDPGNVCDTQPQGCFGSVSSLYQISKYEVTNGQYAEFLNAVAATDTNSLYSGNMGSGLGGITRSGVSGSYAYSTIAGRANMPVNYVSFYDSLRFANWLQNGQPTGAQGNGTTEGGAYTITAGGIAANSIARNALATFFLPSENEWYKAAYYNVSSLTYYNYPAGLDAQTVCATPTGTANRANCNSAAGGLTNVGSYTGSASPNGTFDQGGNVWEWNERILLALDRGLRGGSFIDIGPGFLAASFQHHSNPIFEYSNVGFRVASLPVPEPAQGLLVLMSLLRLAFMGRRRGRCSQGEDHGGAATQACAVFVVT